MLFPKILYTVDLLSARIKLVVCQSDVPLQHGGILSHRGPEYDDSSAYAKSPTLFGKAPICLYESALWVV